MFDRPEQLHSSVVHQPTILPAELVEEAEPSTASLPIISVGEFIPYKPPPRRPHRIIPAGPPLAASAHLANITYERMYYSYDIRDKFGMLTAGMLAIVASMAGLFVWMILQGGVL